MSMPSGLRRVRGHRPPSANTPTSTPAMFFAAIFLGACDAACAAGARRGRPTSGTERARVGVPIAAGRRARRTAGGRRSGGSSQTPQPPRLICAHRISSAAKRSAHSAGALRRTAPGSRAPRRGRQLRRRRGRYSTNPCLADFGPGCSLLRSGWRFATTGGSPIGVQDVALRGGGYGSWRPRRRAM